MSFTLRVSYKTVFFVIVRMLTTLPLFVFCQISPAMIELRQKIKYAEQEIADSDHQLNVANRKHADIAAKGGDTSELEWRKSRQENRLNYWIQTWKNMKNRYESALRGGTYFFSTKAL